jgi:hypothetical protein
MNDIKVEGHIASEINPDSISEADIVVGIYSHNNSDNMELSILKASGGLSRYYPELRGAIVNLDACSEDGTKEVFLSASSDIPKIYVSVPPDKRLKKYCFFNLVNVARRLKARAVISFEAATATIKKTWVPRLLEPILKHGACYTSPIYSRQFFDLPVTFLLSYPMFRALFGRRLRNPNLGDAAFSGSLNEVFYNTTEWPDEDSYFSVEIATAAMAVNHGPVFQSFMGDPRVGKKRLLVDIFLGEEFYQILHTYYELMVLYPDYWQKSLRSRPTPILGTDLKPEILPPRQLASSPSAFHNLIQGISLESQELWSRNFPDHMSLLKEFQSAPLEKMEVSIEEWVSLIFEGAAKYRDLPKEEGEALTRSLIPAFFVRLLNFKNLISSLPQGQMASLIEDEAVVFEKMKPKLLEEWGILKRNPV